MTPLLPPTTMTPTKFLLLLTFFFLFLLSLSSSSSFLPGAFREAPIFRNNVECPSSETQTATIHVAITLDRTYLRGSLACVLSVLRHASCPEHVFFHFLASSSRLRRSPDLRRVLVEAFPYLSFRIYPFDAGLVRDKISVSLRRALDQPLNYARIYLADLLPAEVRRIVYFDSDLILVDDVAKLWSIDLNSAVLGAPEYCHANFTTYFTPKFWSNPIFSNAFENRSPCYFNTGVMVIDLHRWRQGKYTEKLEHWMKIQKRYRIYELGSLPPFLLVFAGNVKGVEHRWNQHGLGGDNLEGLCRDLHPGPVSLLHWSGKGKPWLRLDSKKPCPLDSLWAPYDLFHHAPLFSDS